MKFLPTDQADYSPGELLTEGLTRADQERLLMAIDSLNQIEAPIGLRTRLLAIPDHVAPRLSWWDWLRARSAPICLATATVVAVVVALSPFSSMRVPPGSIEVALSEDDLDLILFGLDAQEEDELSETVFIEEII